MVSVGNMTGLWRRSGAAIGLAVSLYGLAALPALAQGNRVAEIAMYEGGDRQTRLVEGMKREGELSVYSSMPVEDNTAVIGAFEKKYGIKVKVWRGSSEDIVRRTVTEIRSGRYEVDVVLNNGLGLEPLHREKILQEVKSPYLADLIPQAIPPHREWVAKYLNLFAQAYNTNLVKKEDVPKSWRDLVKPEWKGKLGIEAEDYDWLAEVVRDMGEQEGLKLFRDIVAANGISVRRGHTLLTNLVAAGEVPFALTVYSFTAQQLKDKGAPLDLFFIPPAIARPNGVGVIKTAQHPNAAVLLFDFLLSDAQKIFAERNFVPTSKKFDSPVTKGPLRIVDTALMLDQGRPWQEQFERIFVKQNR
jgi:iron(III) transport system substrate-binding protein